MHLPTHLPMHLPMYLTPGRFLSLPTSGYRAFHSSRGKHIGHRHSLLRLSFLDSSLDLPRYEYLPTLPHRVADISVFAAPTPHNRYLNILNI